MNTEPEYSTLQWWLMPDHGGPQPETTTCLFTDGYGTEILGWWSRSNQHLMVPNHNGRRGVVDHSKMKWWAKLENLQGFAPTRNAVPGIE